MKKTYKFILGGFLVALIILIFSINSIVKNILISAFEDKTNKSITINKIWINPFTGNISAKNVVISEEEKNLFSLKSFKLDFSPFDLAKGNLYIDEITIIEPTIDINKDDEVLVDDSSTTSSQDAKSPEKIKEAEETVASSKEEVSTYTSKDPFIKEVVIKNITVKNLVFENNQTQFKSLNTFTLEVPTFIYREEILDISATLDIIDSGQLKVDLTANTNSGQIEGSLSSESLALSTTLTKDDQIFDIMGIFDGELRIFGNYLKKEGELSGPFNFKDISLSSSSSEIFNSGNLKVDIEKLTYPDINILSKGSYSLSLTSELLPLLLENEPDINMAFQGGDLEGTYSLNYPKLILSPHLTAEEIIVSSTENTPYNGSLKVLEGRYYINTDLLDKSTTLTGITDLNSFDFADLDENSLFFRSGQVDLSFSSLEDLSETIINNIKFDNGELVIKGTELTNVSLESSNITDKKIDSPLLLSARSSDFSKLTANLKVKTEDMKDFSDLTLSGDLNIENLKLESLNKFIDDLPYDLEGFVSNNSYISYSKDNITSVGKMTGNNLKIKGDGLDLSMDKFSSTLDLSMKEESITLNNTKFSGSSVKIKDKEVDLSIGNFNSTSNINKREDNLILTNTSISFNNLKGNFDNNTNINLPKGSVSIKKYTPKDINLNNLILNSPIITITKVTQEVKSSGSSTTQKTAEINPKVETTTKPASTNNSKAEVSTKTKTEEKLDLFIGKLDIKNAIYHEITGGKKTSYTNLKLYSENFTSKKGKNFNLDSSVSLEGMDNIYLKGIVSLSNDWDFDLKTINFKGDIGVSKITLSKFNDELSKSIPNKIEDGYLKSSGNIKLNKGVIDSNNKMVLSDLRLGEATGIASKVPLDKVIDSLKNNNGDINIDVPLKGDLNDPEFKISKIILNVLISNFSNILKNPEKAISSILTIGSSNKEDVIYFDYLDSRPKSSDLKKLDTTMETLAANPNSKLKVTLFTNDKVEEGIMKGKSLASSLFGKKKESSDDELDELMEERKDYILNYLTKEIDESRIDINISNRDKSLPQAKLEIEF